MTIAHEPAISASSPGGALAADALLEPWFSSLQNQLGETRIFDCHTHLGCADPDGSCFDVDELSGALAAVDGRAVVFPLAEPGGYRAANDRTLAAAKAAEGRLVAFCRVDPHSGAVGELERAVGRGAAGIKLHPRAERFGLDEPAVRGIFGFANERRLPIIVHAGRGIPSLGADALALARDYPMGPADPRPRGDRGSVMDLARGGRATQPVLRYRLVEHRRSAGPVRAAPARPDPVRL